MTQLFSLLFKLWYFVLHMMSSVGDTFHGHFCFHIISAWLFFWSFLEWNLLSLTILHWLPYFIQLLVFYSLGVLHEVFVLIKHICYGSFVLFEGSFTSRHLSPLLWDWCILEGRFGLAFCVIFVSLLLHEDFCVWSQCCLSLFFFPFLLFLTSIFFLIQVSHFIFYIGVWSVQARSKVCWPEMLISSVELVFRLLRSIISAPPTPRVSKYLQ